MPAQQPFHHFLGWTCSLTILVERLHTFPNDVELFLRHGRLFVCVGALRGRGLLAGHVALILRRCAYVSNRRVNNRKQGSGPTPAGRQSFLRAAERLSSLRRTPERRQLAWVMTTQSGSAPTFPTNPGLVYLCPGYG
jgi:hypothetical protein